MLTDEILFTYFVFWQVKSINIILKYNIIEQFVKFKVSFLFIAQTSKLH